MPSLTAYDYTQGMLIGYCSIINLLKHQAFVFCIDQKELGLADIRPDVDLLGLFRNPGIEFEEENWKIDVMNKKKIKGYLSDTITLLKEQAIEAKKEADNAKEESERYNRAEFMAYCVAILLFKSQAQAFKIDETELGLADLDAYAFDHEL
jgi:hypothetical protein